MGKHLMNKALLTVALLGLCATVLTGSAQAGRDEYLGDSSIYAGVPTTMTKPNVLIIVDNSRATLNRAPGEEYKPGTVYGVVPEPGKVCAAGVSSPMNGCFLPWYIYSIDNQGDVGNQHVRANNTNALENLTCANNDDVVRKTLVQRGTYSGSGTADYPNINGNTGACDTAPQGKVYVLGNYLNYSRANTTPPALPDEVPAVCSAPNPIVKACEWKNNDWNCDGPGAKFAYFQLRDTILGTNQTATHTPSDFGYTEVNSPYYSRLGTAANAPDNPETLYWNQVANAPAGTPQWLPGTTYTTTLDSKPPLDVNPDNKTCAQLIADAGATPPAQANSLTQREVIYNALELAIGGAIGAVNVGAMTYGSNNSGGTLIFPMADLSVGAPSGIDGETGEVKPIAPDCSLQVNANLPFCQFLKALPGLRKEADPFSKPNYSCSDFYGAGCVNSATGRPQAESVFDAGYYFGAQYQSITNTARIADTIKNECGLNHIILLTNGFTNGDNSPRMAIVGDADGDGYPNENVYGLGSHWLDDVAKHLNVNYGITFHAVIAFQEKDDLVENAAVVDGGGRFYQAYNAQQLAKKLTDLLAGIINPASTSFVAPVVPASTTNRTISSNKVYLGLFRPQEAGPWRGNVKKYSVSEGASNQLMGYDGTAATDPYGAFYRDSISYWSLAGSIVPSARGDIDPTGTDPNKPKGDGGEVDAGGIGGKLLKRVEALAEAVRTGGWAQNTVPWRKIYTYPPTTYTLPGVVDLTSSNSYKFSVGNSVADHNPSFSPSWFGYDPVADPNAWAKARNLIRYVHGFANNDLGLSGTAEARPWVMGDVLHSRPQVVSYNRYSDLHENVCTPGADGGYNGSVIYVGANDGMLHAFRDCDGEELWAFVPPNAHGGLRFLKDPAVGHPTFMDGAPSFFKFDKNGDGIINPADDKVILVIGQRRGGGKEWAAAEYADDTYSLYEAVIRGEYFALDVTVPTAPKFLWRTPFMASPYNYEIGETWSQPIMAKILHSDTADTRVVKQVFFIGGGYDNNEDLRYGNTQTFMNPTSPVHIDINTASAGGSVDGLAGGADLRMTSSGTLTTDQLNNLATAPSYYVGGVVKGRAIYAVEVATFTLNKADKSSTVTVNAGAPVVYWRYTNNDMDFSFPTDLTVLDIDGNGFADRIYAGDTGGNLWRFDLSAPDKNNWYGEIMFRSNPGYDKDTGASDGSNGRKIFYPPAVAVYAGAPHIYFGTGDREHPLNRAVTDRMYCVVDWKSAGATVTWPLNESHLEDVTTNEMQETSTGSATLDAEAIADLKKRLYSSPTRPYDDQGNYSSGWYIKLDGTDLSNSVDPGEKILAQPEVFSGAVYFNTYKLLTGARAGCDAGNLGQSYGYAVDFKTGEAVFNFNAANDLSVNLDDASAVTAFLAQTNERAVGDLPGEMLLRADRRRALGAGIPSGAVIVVDSAGRVKLLMSSSEKVSVFEGYSTKAVHPVYWMQW
jgi:type IV pilus assembly protein PilY1